MLSLYGNRLLQPRSIAVFARRELVGRMSLGVCVAGFRPAVLLEGSWPQSYPPERFFSLDEAFDATEAWIDEHAARLAEKAGPEPWLRSQHGCCELKTCLKTYLVPPAHRGRGRVGEGVENLTEVLSPTLNAAWLHRLGLCYHLVKLLRVGAFFRHKFPLRSDDQLHVFLEKDRDGYYAHLLRQLAAQSGAVCRVHWLESSNPARPSGVPRPWYRRCLEWLAERVGSPAGRDRGQVFLFGSPIRLGPVCDELLRAGARVWWMVDRLPLRVWLRWRRRGVGFLSSRSDSGRVNRLGFQIPQPLLWEKVDLKEPVATWLSARLETEGAALTQVTAAFDNHLRRCGPGTVLLDEDATPLARALVAVAHRHGTRSYVVQHGAPYCRFGFSPLAADGILAWGRASAERLTGWGIDPQRVITVGCPALHLERAGKAARRMRTCEHRHRPHRSCSSPLKSQRCARCANNAPGGRKRSIRYPLGVTPCKRVPTLLMFATVPPRDARPDALALQLTSRRYERLLGDAFEAIGRISPVQLFIKRHPRARNDAVLLELAGSERRFPVRFVTGPLHRWVARCDCVLSCMSSAGVEAAHLGVPVIQLAPPGADCLQAEQWGMMGTAHNAEELYELLNTVLHTVGEPPGVDHSGAFALVGHRAASQIAALVLGENRSWDDPVLAGSHIGRAEQNHGEQRGIERQVNRAA